MADPTAAQKRVYAKMGYAMPDGSYYIRDGADGAQDLQNAIHAVGRGEAPDKSGAEIRKHIIKRATALKLTKEIPDTWSSNGMLKQGVLELGQDFIEHFGVKGMHWGVRHTREQLLSEAKKHDDKAKASYKLAQYHLNANKDLETHGVHSADFEAHYGKGAALQNPGLFQLAYGRNKAQAVAELSEFHRASHNSAIRSTNRHFKKADKLRARAKQIEHSDESGIEHFGVKGMHWGQRKAGTGTASSHVSEDAARATGIHSTVKTHGASSVSNEDLQHLVTRLNLEQQYNKLTPEHVSAGKKFTGEVLKIGGNVAKSQATSYGNKYANKAIQDLIEGAARNQRHRSNNKPLKVVSIR